MPTPLLPTTQFIEVVIAAVLLHASGVHFQRRHAGCEIIVGIFKRIIGSIIVVGSQQRLVEMVLVHEVLQLIGNVLPAHSIQIGPVIVPIHQDAQEDGEDDGTAECVNAEHAFDAQGGQASAAGVDATHDGPARLLRPLRIVKDLVYEGEAGGTFALLDEVALVVALPMQQLLADLSRRVHGMRDFQKLRQIVEHALLDGARIDVPIEMQHADHDAHHEDVGQAPFAERPEHPQQAASALPAASEEEGQVEQHQLHVRPHAREHDEQPGGDARQRLGRHLLGLPQLLDGKPVRERFDVLVLLVHEVLVLLHAQSIECRPRDR
mmetsp:Transcript_17374/g.48991  ORF Transcript_17374/g.48991 Transcript_17374/m.48991 type:complete len:322 (+) Transcript_17374:850-1815(+)